MNTTSARVEASIGSAPEPSQRHGRFLHARLIDVVIGRSGTVYADWLKAQPGEFIAGIARVHQHGATAKWSSLTPTSQQGAPSNDKNPPLRGDEPDDHGIGRSRGGLTTKTHALVDGHGLPLVLAVTPGQAGDSPALPRLLAELKVGRTGPDRAGPGPPQRRYAATRPTPPGHTGLRSRGITAVIPERSDQLAHRQNRGSDGGRPPTFDTEDYKNRNVVERAFNRLKNWRGLATRYDKHALIYRGGMVLASIILWLTWT